MRLRLWIAAQIPRLLVTPSWRTRQITDSECLTSVKRPRYSVDVVQIIPIETTVVLSLLLTVAGAIRRLYFHPLAHIPGPRLAALTWWYEFYFDAIQQGRYVFKIQELHKEYGRSQQFKHSY